MLYLKKINKKINFSILLEKIIEIELNKLSFKKNGIIFKIKSIVRY